jgi:alanyl-tRNA synthetase
MGEAYPELRRAQATVVETLRQEEERFRTTLGRGIGLLEEATANLPEGGVLSGETAFKLYDTYGFPLDLTQDAVRAKGLSVDAAGFERPWSASASWPAPIGRDRARRPGRRMAVHPRPPRAHRLRRL